MIYWKNIYSTLAQEVHALARTLDDEVTLHLDIRRSHVLVDALREAKKKKFSPAKMVQVLMSNFVRCLI